MELIILANGEHVHLLPAAAEGELGEKVHTTDDSANTAAGSGLHDADCSALVALWEFSILNGSFSICEFICFTTENERIIAATAGNNKIHRDRLNLRYRAPIRMINGQTHTPWLNKNE